MEPETFRFYKVTEPEREGYGRWFIDYPDWDGDPFDLEMVMGADTMLDHLAGEGNNEVLMVFSDEHFDGYQFHLEYLYPYYEGGMYRYVKEDEDPFELWLCHVTKYIFGYLPEYIYCHVNFTLKSWTTTMKEGYIDYDGKVRFYGDDE